MLAAEPARDNLARDNQYYSMRYNIYNFIICDKTLLWFYSMRSNLLYCIILHSIIWYTIMLQHILLYGMISIILGCVLYYTILY